MIAKVDALLAAGIETVSRGELLHFACADVARNEGNEYQILSGRMHCTEVKALGSVPRLKVVKALQGLAIFAHFIQL